jgi:predicted DNA-binding protein (MmcQ/YjbR family)
VADVRDRLRTFALSLPEAAEEFPWGGSAAKVRGKVFAFLGAEHDDGARLTVKLVESHAHALSVEQAEPTRYGLGKSGWMTLPFAAPGLSVDILRDWIEESYRIVAPKRLVAELDRRGTSEP